MPKRPSPAAYLIAYSSRYNPRRNLRRKFMANVPIIVIADDQPHIQMALEYLARSAGPVRVMLAHHGDEVCHLALEHKPLLVILGMHMPGINAIAAARIIRDQWQNHTGKIWLIAGCLQPPSDEDVMDAGADCVITYPFDPNLITDAIRAALAETPAGRTRQP